MPDTMGIEILVSAREVLLKFSIPQCILDYIPRELIGAGITKKSRSTWISFFLGF